jgi:thiol-disulfide isomerase/thioredoxin
MGPIEAGLDGKGTGPATAKRLLDRRAEFKLGDVVEKRLTTMAEAKQTESAARLLLRIVSAKATLNQFGKGGVAIGKVETADGKLSPEFVLAQMPITAEGYFAAEVGDMTKPIGFRAAGYEEVLAPLAGKAGEVFDVGTVVLQPIPAGKSATLKGKVTLDIPDRGPAALKLSLMVPKPNTPHGGYSPRRAWPKPTEVEIAKDGSFSAAGLTPGDYYMALTASSHANVNKPLKLAGGETKDAGTFALRTTDLGFYIGKPAPKTGELPWEKDYQAAMAKAATEKKPVMVMMTATWCGPCKMLEKETLNDPWVKHFLADFIIVKAYEDKQVEAKYPMNGYPTLVFTDSQGKEMHRTVGFQPTTKFLEQCVTGMKKLALKLPEDLQLLIDKKILGAG